MRGKACNLCRIWLEYFGKLMYSIVNERGVCFRTALGESLCGSLLCLYRFLCHALIYLSGQIDCKINLNRWAAAG